MFRQNLVAALLLSQLTVEGGEGIGAGASAPHGEVHTAEVRPPPNNARESATRTLLKPAKVISKAGASMSA